MPQPFSAPFSKRLLALLFLLVIVGGAYVSYRSTARHPTGKDEGDFYHAGLFLFQSCVVMTNLVALLLHRNFPGQVVLHLTLNLVTAINGVITGMFVLVLGIFWFHVATQHDLALRWHDYLFYLPVGCNLALLWVFVQPVQHPDR
ncbi:MAG TPA: hypothetical protein VF690_19185 [Hymenobacter sp.]